MKKTVAFLLAALVLAMLCLPVSAFVPQKIKSLRGDFASSLTDISLDGEAIGASGLTQIRAYPASELEIVLAGSLPDIDLFLDQNGEPINTADVTISKMRATNVVVKADILTGIDILKDIELTVRNAGTSAAKPVIRLGFPNECESLESIGFSAIFCISVSGEEQAGSNFKISGVFGNPEIEVDSGDMAVNANSAVLLAKDNIPLISVDAGHGVLAEVSMRAGGRYLLKAASSDDEYDLALIQESNGVVDVIKLNVAGFERNQIISVNIENEQILQVYDENGKWIGTTSQKLPYAEKYYLRSLKVA